MYAAAGGASLASRQARQRQRQNKKAQLQKSQKATELIPKQPQSKPFHNYTDQMVPKLSRVERNVLKPPMPHDRRHSTSNYHLKEPSRARIRESPSICIPVQNHHQKEQAQPLTPATLVQNHLPHSPSIQSQLPQITIPEGDTSLERRCSFVRQVEEMEKVTHEGGGNVLDRCNHICNFEIKEKQWDNNVAFYTEYDKTGLGSLDYPFSECSQGRAAWQERERGRRCSLSDDARQHRLKQSEAHHRWMKRNRIHDATFGGSTDDDDIFNVYHQSAAANALLYVGLGTIAMGSVIFFVGTGEKGFKTLELRLIGPTMMACGLLCCLIRVLLCACPSNCIRRRKKARLKDTCPHNTSRYPKKRDRRKDFIPVEQASLMKQKNHKKVSIAAGTSHAVPSTSTMNEPTIYVEDDDAASALPQPLKPQIPLISIPDFADFNSDETQRHLSRDNSIIELQSMEISYEVQSVSSCDSDTVIEVERPQSKLVKCREPAKQTAYENETCLSVVIEKCDGENVVRGCDKVDKEIKRLETRNSEIVLSPLQLGQ